MKFIFLQFRKTLVASCLILLGLTINAQTSFQWARSMGGSLNGDRANAIAVDASGNVYSTGAFQGVSDFDPGPGTFTLSSNGGYDIFISKLDANGNFVWAKQIGGTSFDFGRAITLDGTGNVNVAGAYQGTVDFDPNIGVNNLTSAGMNDAFVIKISPAGNLIWAKSMGGSNVEDLQGIAADASGNVFTTGYFNNTADFDPGIGTFTMTAVLGNADAFISKLDASGNFVWAKQFLAISSNAGANAFDIELDGAGNVITGGAFSGTRDFDPGAGTFTMAAINSDIFISKLDPSGNFVWAKNMGGPSGSNQVSGISSDAANNVYCTGYFQGTTDFDPGAGTFTIASLGAVDVFIFKLDASGNLGWAKQIGGTGSDQGKAIDVTPAGDVYTTGFFGNTVDFDPGVGTYTLSNIGGSGVFISRLDASGNFVWANAFGFSNAMGNGIALSPFLDVYTGGSYDQTTDFDPSAGTYTLTPSAGGGNDDIFIHKLGQTTCPTFSMNSSSSSFTLMCAITSQTLNAVNTNSTASVTYTWTAPSSATTTGASYVATAAGVYTVSASAPSTTCIVTQTLAIIQTTGNVAFNINTTGSTCNNNGSATVSVTGGTAPFTYTWSTGSNASNVSSLSPGTYSLIVKDANQCTNTNTFSILNTAATFSSVPICFVSVDSLSQYNVITWDKTMFPTADSFFVYREISTNNYQKICSQPYSTLSQFVDTVRAKYFPNTGDPNVGTYRYKMITRDNCGNYSTFSPYHNTIFIINSSGTFSWPQLYSIESAGNPVTAYILERDNFSTGVWTTVGSVAGTQSFIIDPNYSTYAATAIWRVKTQWSIACTATLKTSLGPSPSLSNRIKNNSLGIKDNKIDGLVTIYPNPSEGRFNFKFLDGNKVRVDIYNTIGEKVLSFEEVQDQLLVDMNTFSKGVYFANVCSEGKTGTIKLILQ